MSKGALAASTADWLVSESSTKQSGAGVRFYEVCGLCDAPPLADREQLLKSPQTASIRVAEKTDPGQLDMTYGVNHPGVTRSKSAPVAERESDHHHTPHPPHSPKPPTPQHSTPRAPKTVDKGRRVAFA